NAMPRRCGQNFANSSWGLARSDQGNDPSHEHGNRRVEQRHHQPGGEQCSEQALRLAGEGPEERDKTGRGTAWSGDSVGLNSRSKSENMTPTRKGSESAPTPLKAPDRPSLH